MANTYDVGDLIRITGTFTDSNGDATDPDTVTAKHKDPSGNIATETSPTKSATGIYYIDVEADESGKWWYRFEGKSSGNSYQGADEAYFFVEGSEFS